MESLRLAEFCRSVSEWPTTVGGWDAVAERLLALVPDALGAGVVLRDGGFSWNGPGSRDRIESKLRSSLDSSLGPSGIDLPGLKQFQLQGLMPGQEGPVHLATAPVLAWARGEGPREKRERRTLGWVCVVSVKVHPTRIEAIILAAAQHLGGLATEARLEHEIRVRDQFLSIASHELKTPLTSIYGIVQLQERMLRAGPDQALSPEKEKQRSFLKIVIRQVERLNELIDGLLDVSRIQNGRFTVEPLDADVAAILRETVQSRLSFIAEEAGVRIQVDAPGELSGRVDRVRFEEVLTNLGMNAIRFSPEGGVVWFRLSNDDVNTVLSVRDQGPAVPESDRVRIFQPFERASRTGRMGGLGLGLFISRQIAELHGGSVLLEESVPGKGNLFTARFPRRVAQERIA